MYQEGVLLGDYVITEFVQSGRVFEILNFDEKLRTKLTLRLQKEVDAHRQFCLEMLEQSEFIQSSLAQADPQPVTPATPLDVSKSILASLQSSPLAKQNLGRTVSARPVASSVFQSSSSAKPAARDGPVFGLASADSSPSEESQIDQLIARPSTPTELKILADNVYKANAPMNLYGVLDLDKISFSRLDTSRKYLTKKRRKGLGEGIFDKDGSYHAVAYGGFVHLCGGALEWPFKTAEISLSHFFKVD